MRVRLTLKPGQPGTKGPLARYGKRLVCVRYRYDEQTHQQVKTVELIESRKNWEADDASRGSESMMAVRVGRQELELRRAPLILAVRRLGRWGAYEHARRDQGRAVFNRSQKNRVLSILILAAILVIGAAQLTGAIESLWRQIRDGGRSAERAEYCELLEPTIFQLDRTKRAYDRWKNQNLPLEYNILLDGNEEIKKLLLEKEHLVPTELKDDAKKLLDHYDRREFERLQGVELEDNPFPRDSAEGFRSRHAELTVKLGEGPCL